MNYRDTLVKCQTCDKQFVFTVEKQRQMADRGQEVVVPDMCEECTQRVKYDGKLHGRVKWFNPEKRYGFIVQDSGGEIFCHQDGLLPDGEGNLPAMDEGQEVLYIVMDTPKGPQAIQVTAYSA